MALIDAELVSLARGGDIGGLAVLLERHRACLRAIGVTMLGTGPHNEDLVHDVFSWLCGGSTRFVTPTRLAPG